MGFRTNYMAGEPGHPDTHNRLHQRLNAAPHVNDPLFTSVQDAFNRSSTLYFPPGAYSGGDLVIDHDLTIAAAPTATLNCTSLTVARPNTLLHVQLSGLTIRTARVSPAGIIIDLASVHLQDANLYNSQGDVIQLHACQNCHFDRVLVQRSDNLSGIAFDANYNTSLVFTSCYFRRGLMACHLQAVSDACFTGCVFETTRQGLVADDMKCLTVYSPYFENVALEQMVVGAVRSVDSFVLVNPIVRPGADNDPSTAGFVTDHVTSFIWLGGFSDTPKAALIQSSPNTLNRQFIFPPS